MISIMNTYKTIMILDMTLTRFIDSANHLNANREHYIRKKVALH